MILQSINNDVMQFKYLLFLTCVLAQSFCYAFKANTYSAGLSYYSENFLNMTAQKDDGSSGLLGETNYPLHLKYDYSLSRSWFLTPGFSATLFPRTSAGSTAKVSLYHLNFLFGKNFDGAKGVTLDWNYGLGLMYHEIKGAGGTKVMNNGTSTATFAIPERTTSIKKITNQLGGSATWNQHQFGLALIFENFFSSSKRTQNLLMSYSYQFGSSQGRSQR